MLLFLVHLSFKWQIQQSMPKRGRTGASDNNHFTIKDQSVVTMLHDLYSSQNRNESYCEKNFVIDENKETLFARSEYFPLPSINKTNKTK